MAGIGFELRKVIGRGSLGSFLKAALSGTMIVAGPWLLSIVSIVLIYNVTDLALQRNVGLFIAPVVYTYASSLLLFSWFHFLFTRIIADQMFDRRPRDAAASLVVSMVAVGIAAAVIGPVGLLLLGPFPVGHPALYFVAAVVLFVTVNLIWVVMLFISILKNYNQIVLAYAVGLAVSVGLSILLSDPFGLAGALAGFAFGHIVIVTLLLVLALRSYTPGDLRGQLPLFRQYFNRYVPLLAAGLLYNWGIWVDKIVYWIMLGDSVAGTGFALLERYDLAVYVGTLSMIPGLVYFVVVSETAVYVLLRKFLAALGGRPYGEIQRRKARLERGIQRSVVDQSIFQGVVTLGLLLAARWLVGPLTGGAVPIPIFVTTLVAVFAHLLLLTFLNLQFYLELYRSAFGAALTFFGVNLAVSFLTPWLPGASYLAGAAVAAVTAGVLLYRGARVLDRRILAGI